jgi:SAM-dependent methyltransferase
LDVELLRAAAGQVDRGQLRCRGCAAAFPIRHGIPRFVGGEGYVASFGRQWTRYAVERLEEDEATFQAKTGFRLDELGGRDVLDAGCGGGRYSFVAARHGARVLAVDMSRAIDRTAQMCDQFSTVDFVQADLLHLPIADRSFELAFSIGVLHHSSDAATAFRQVAATIRLGGRLAVWLYRRNTPVQECVNEVLREITRRMSVGQLESIATLGAVLGSIPIVNRTLNKVVNFSNHPIWENRVCDTFDWFSPRFQSHHTVSELMGWFRAAGFDYLRELTPERSGRLYDWAYKHDLIIGSGVNVVGTRPD